MGEEPDDCDGGSLEIAHAVLGQRLEIIPTNLNVVCLSVQVCPILVGVQSSLVRSRRVSRWAADLASVLNQRLSDSLFCAAMSQREYGKSLLRRRGELLREIVHPATSPALQSGPIPSPLRSLC